MSLVPLLALVVKKSKYKVKPTTEYLCKKVEIEKCMPQIMETLRKYLCKYTNMWLQLHQEPGNHVRIAKKPEPKVKGPKLTFCRLWSSHWSHPGWRTLKWENEVICSSHFPSLTGVLLPRNGPCAFQPLWTAHLFPMKFTWQGPMSPRPPRPQRPLAGFIIYCSVFLQNLSLEILISPLTHNLFYFPIILCLTSP